MAAAAAPRSAGPGLDWIPVLPPVLPEFTSWYVSQVPWRTMLIGRLSSSANSWSSPVVTPLPTSTWLVLSVATPSAPIDNHESTCEISGR